MNVAGWFDDADGDTLTYSVAFHDNVTVTIDQGTGLANLNPERDFNGQNAAVWTACDTNLTCIDVPVPILVAAANDAPSARGNLPFLECDEDSSVQLNIATINYNGTLGAFFDIDGDTLTYRVAGVPAELDVQVLGSVITIRPQPDVANVFFFTVAAWDGHNESFPASVKVTVRPINDAPVINVKTPGSSTTNVVEGAFKDFGVTASDVDGDTLNYTWFVATVGQNNQAQPTFRYAAEVTSEGDRSVIVKVNVSDKHGGYAEASWTLVIENLNQAPSAVTITSPSGDAAHRTFVEGADISFSSTATDPDGDTLNYSWSSDRVFAPIGDQQTFTTKLSPGTHDITLRVTDGKGGEARTNVTVIVTPAGGGNNPTNNMGLIVGAVVAIAAVGGAAVFLMRRGKKEQPPKV